MYQLHTKTVCRVRYLLSFTVKMDWYGVCVGMA